MMNVFISPNRLLISDSSSDDNFRARGELFLWWQLEKERAVLLAVLCFSRRLLVRTDALLSGTIQHLIVLVLISFYLVTVYYSSL